MQPVSSILGGKSPKPRGGRHVPVPTVLQMEATECGAACLGMILGRLGLWIPLEELRVRCGVSRDGVSAGKIVRAAKNLGVEVRGKRVHPGRLVELRPPMMIHWEFKHFVILEGFRRDRVYINDPRGGRRVISWDDLEASFSGTCLLFEPGPDFRKGGRPAGALSGLFSRLGHAKTTLFYVFLASAALIFPGIASATLAKVFVDEVLIPLSGSLMVPLMIGLGVVALLQGGLVWLQQTCLARMEIKIAVVSAVRFFDHLFSLPMLFFQQRHAGDITSRIMSNDRVAQMISGELATSAVSLLATLVYGGVLLSYDPVLACAVFAMVLLNVAALRAVQRVREDGARRLLREQSQVAATSVSGLSMIETLKAGGSENWFFSRWTGMHARAVEAQQSLGTITGLLNVVPPLISTMTTVTILGFGGYRMLEGVLTVGGLVAFQSLARNFSGPVEQLVRFSANLQTIKSDITRLDDVLNYPPEKTLEESGESIKSVPAVDRSFKIENLTFGYNASEPPLIENFHLSIAPGKTVALVGGSGSGKSTIGKLACGVLSPWSGSVLLGGVDIKRVPLDQLSSVISYVDQDIVLFDGTVRENVTLWNPAIDEQMVTRALRDAAVLDAVMSRPGKYDAPVGENGSGFSGGQRQLLELARSIAADPDILVLDEATSALDPITETQIDDNLRRRGVTCLIIAHRLSTIRDADQIVVMERGRIVEQGTHEQLIAKKGAYSALIASE